MLKFGYYFTSMPESVDLPYFSQKIPALSGREKRLYIVCFLPANIVPALPPFMIS
jgi:hypothetical protein